MRFSVYNGLFSIVKGQEETLPAVASRVEEAIVRVVELRPAQITEVTASPSGGSTQITRAYAIGDLDNKLAFMAMLRSLPREEYADFVLSLMRQKDLTRANVKAAFQVEQTERNTHCGPLLSPFSDAALRTTAQAPRVNKPGVKCGFCTGDGHTEEDCYKKERARKDAQKVVEERHAGRNGGKKARANRAVAASPPSPALSDGAKVTELAASASVRLAGSLDTHADAHWITDMGATSHMSPCRSWFTKLEPLAIPSRGMNDHVMYSKGVGSVVMEPADKSINPGGLAGAGVAGDSVRTSADMINTTKAVSSDTEPKSYHDAMHRPDSELWHQAMVHEMEAHLKNGTWELVKLPHGRKAIGSKWVFKVKCNPDGTVERYKARLVAKGFGQRPGVDFDEMFAPTTKWAALRAILALATLENLELESIDISNAYLNGELHNVDVYMQQPDSFAERDSTWVARLLKGLYGLKQGGREWFCRLEEVLVELGFVRICSDLSVFIWEKDGVKVIVPVFVDDITPASKSKEKIAEIKGLLAQRFKLRDLGPTSFLLGVQINHERSARTLHLSQRQYTLDLLDRFGFADCSPVSTPLDPGSRLDMSQCPQTPEDNEFMRDKPYVSAVGVLMYLAIATRPDIAHAVGVFCRFMSKPGPAHWKAAKHLFRYLRGSVDYRLRYAPGPSSLQLFTTYSNADHGGNPDNSRSMSAYIVKMGTGAVSWMSRLQSIVALSTTEAEFISAVSAGQEIVWMRSFLGELGYSFDGPSLLLVDNQSAIQVARNPEHHGRTKHLDLRFFWLRDMVNLGVIAVRYIPTADMAADLLTKALARVKVAAALPQLGLTAP
jgi:hypothetical protein